MEKLLALTQYQTAVLPFDILGLATQKIVSTFLGMSAEVGGSAFLVFHPPHPKNMEGLVLQVPSSLFYTQTEAVAAITAMLTAINSFGRNATIAELVGATTRLEKLVVLGAFYASYYTGAAIGSFAVATGRYSSGGTSLSDVMFDIHQNGITVPAWLHTHFARHPEILDRNHPARSAYAIRARQ